MSENTEVAENEESEVVAEEPVAAVEPAVEETEVEETEVVETEVEETAENDEPMHYTGIAIQDIMDNGDGTYSVTFQELFADFPVFVSMEEYESMNLGCTYSFADWAENYVCVDDSNGYYFSPYSDMKPSDLGENYFWVSSENVENGKIRVYALPISASSKDQWIAFEDQKMLDNSVLIIPGEAKFTRERFNGYSLSTEMETTLDEAIRNELYQDVEELWYYEVYRDELDPTKFSILQYPSAG